jgi:ABC-type multidrug transport system ATPase subunit
VVSHLVRMTVSILSWNIAKYKVNNLIILDNVNGHAQGGQLIGILGKSGSGKTSLLRVLGRRSSRKLSLTGQVKLNGNTYSSNTWRHLCAFVEQHDHLYSFLSPFEVLLFSSALFSNESKLVRREKVNVILQQMGLDDVSHRRIGVLSGGQKKRVSIAIQLLLDPVVLLLDEPTSGLDSKTAQQVIQYLRNLANDRGIIIILTIHMPRVSIVKLFDKIIVVNKGQVVFDGNHSQLSSFVGETGDDSLTDLLLDRVDDFPPFINNSPVPASDPLLSRNTPKPSKFKQLNVLLLRDLLMIWRDKRLIVTSLLQAVVITLLVGIVFWQLGNTQSAIQSTVGVLFFLLINQTFSYMMPLVTAFPVEKIHLYKEYLTAAYPPYFAYVTRYIAQWSIVIVTMTLTVTVLFFLIGLSNFFIYYLALSLVTANAVAIGLTIGSFANSPQIGQASTPTVAISLILVSGLYANKDTIPIFIAWLEYISFVSYGYAILVQNEFSGRQFVCDVRTEVPCYRTGEQVISFYQMDQFSILVLFVLLSSLLVVTWILGAVALTLSFHRKQK